jgi:exopolysaccharide biosynthesis protein
MQNIINENINSRNIKVLNMMSSQGNKIPNQFVIATPEGSYFQSYNSVIAFINNDGQVFLDRNKWDYSTTTGKYRNIFLGENKRLTEKRINNNNYVLIDLNN